MASKTFSGQLDQAMNEAAAEGNKILFIPQQTVGEVLPGAASELVVESDGTYSIKLAYNTYSIYHYSDVTKRKTLLATDIVVSTDTAVTTIPDLLGSAVPVTEDSVLTIQGYLDEANDAKTDAEAAQAATEALFDDFDSSVAESMALVNTDTPALSVTFNDSGRLDYGVGTEYVSGLPVHGVDFTRSTSCYYINKTGLIDYADIDEIAIGKGGAYLHNSFLGGITYSSDVSSSDWDTNNVTIADDGTEPPIVDGVSGLSAYHVVNNANTNFHRIAQVPVGNIGWVTGVAIVKPDDGFKSVKMDIRGGADNEAYKVVVFNADTKTFDTVSGNPNGYGYYELNDGWFLIYLNFYDDTGRAGCQCYLSFSVTGSSSSSFTGDGVNGGYVAYFQRIESNNIIDPRLLCVTDSTTATITETSCTAPVSGNLPPNGESFTIVCDSYVEGSSQTISYSNYYSVGTSSDYIGLAQSRAGVIRVQHSLGAWFAPSALSTDTISRLTLVCEPDVDAGTTDLSLYQDGELVSSQSFSSAFDDISGGTVKFGASSSGSTSLNQAEKNFKILPYAASANEVASWGAPK